MVKSLTFSSIEDRNLYIINQRQAKTSAADISTRLKITKRTVERVYSTYLSTPRVGRTKGSGRKKNPQNRPKETHTK